MAKRQERIINYLVSFLTCRLIPLDKQSGVRPIGIDGVLRRVIGKTVVKLFRKDMLKAVGSLQLCAGQDSCSKAAVHAVYDIFKEDDTKAVVMVDASNTFNSINREAFLRDTKVLCLALATFINTYYSISRYLFVHRGKPLRSSEGTTQGSPAAMAIYN